MAPKPDPSGYSRAVAALSLRPEEVVALEDSPSGLAAAQGAGVVVAAVGHRRPRGPWVGDSIFLADLKDTDLVLRTLGFSAGK